MHDEKEWYISWFNSPYYPLLYRKRDDREAAQFINGLLKVLSPRPDANFIDIACGTGRHSIYLNSKGYKVTGIDLSMNNIETACKYERKDLKFEVGDMRHLLPRKNFDFALNLFTSFGYFDKPDDDKRVLLSVYDCLNPGGILVLDYFNSETSYNEKDESFLKTIDGIEFEIKKMIANGKIIKHITVKEKDLIFNFKEEVRIYSYDSFKQLLDECGFKVVRCFGNYQFDDFQRNTSNRLILIAQKI